MTATVTPTPTSDAPPRSPPQRPGVRAAKAVRPPSSSPRCLWWSPCTSSSPCTGWLSLRPNPPRTCSPPTDSGSRPLSPCGTTLRSVLSYDDGIFIRWFLNSVLYAGVGALAGHVLRRGGRLCPGQVRVPRPEPGVRNHPGRGAGARNRHGPAALPAVQPARPGQHLLERPPAVPGLAVRIVPVPDLLPGHRGHLTDRGRPARRRQRTADLPHDRAARRSPRPWSPCSSSSWWESGTTTSCRW